MYQRILVAIDESATSELALKEAALLGKERNATLRLPMSFSSDDTFAYTALPTPRELVERPSRIARHSSPTFASHWLAVLELELDASVITSAEKSLCSSELSARGGCTTDEFAGPVGRPSARWRVHNHAHDMRRNRVYITSGACTTARMNIKRNRVYTAQAFLSSCLDELQAVFPQ